MRLTPVRDRDPLARRVAARLSARLETDLDRPLALALSGGGDSMALLHLAAAWARDHGRPLLALTVDHRLDPASARWTELAGEAARALGCAWRPLVWDGDKPSAGLAAAARAARHRLIADAAREAGARVVLFAHTADDVAEGERLRAEGSTLGRLREWGPSPVWPEGRGLALLRPLLDVSRAALRDHLAGLGAAWIDDPANLDPRFARARVRAALRGKEPGAAPPPPAPARGVLAVRDDVVFLTRSPDPRALGAALVCAGGGDRAPRGDRLARLRGRLLAGEDFAAVLAGARLEARGGTVLVVREPGEFRRRRPAALPLAPGRDAVWDGRWAVLVERPGWSVRPAAGRLASLSPADRAALAALPPAARAARPVLIRHDGTAPVLAGTGAWTRALVGERLALALDRMTHERDLGHALHGATPRNHLFSGADIME